MKRAENSDDYSQQKFTEKKVIVIYGQRHEYYSIIKSYLIGHSFTIHYFENDFEYALKKIIEIQPQFAILTFPKTQNEIIQVTGLVRQKSPGTHVVLQFPLDTLLSFELDMLNVAGIISDDANVDEVLEALKMISAGLRFIGKDVIENL